MFSYRIATLNDLNQIWDKDIKENPNDNRYIKWKEKFIKNNLANLCKSFIIANDNELIGQGTLVMSTQCFTKAGREELCNGRDTGNISALRIEKKFEGNGHISKLMKVIESYAYEQGFKYLTIGAEAKESRNLSIYLHWGYNDFIMHEITEEENSLVLYYKKNIAKSAE